MTTYKQDVKNKIRNIILKTSVELLTEKRKSTPVVPEDYMRHFKRTKILMAKFNPVSK